MDVDSCSVVNTYAGSLVQGQKSLKIVIIDCTWEKIIGRNDGGIFVKHCEFEI